MNQVYLGFFCEGAKFQILRLGVFTIGRFQSNETRHEKSLQLTNKGIVDFRENFNITVCEEQLVGLSIIVANFNFPQEGQLDLRGQYVSIFARRLLLQSMVCERARDSSYQDS